MEKATWIIQQLKAWGFGGTMVFSNVDQIIYLKKAVAEALTEEQLKVLELVPANDNMFNSLRHNASNTVMVAFNY